MLPPLRGCKRMCRFIFRDADVLATNRPYTGVRHPHRHRSGFGPDMPTVRTVRGSGKDLGCILSPQEVVCDDNFNPNDSYFCSRAYGGRLVWSGGPDPTKSVTQTNST